MYFQDLDKCDYTGSQFFPNLIAIGWLDKEHEFNTGSIPLSAKAKLLELIQTPTNQCKGFHTCDLCTNEELRKLNDDETYYCNGEVHIPKPNAAGTAYASPVMILHYIEMHNYRPPQEFINAVMALVKQ